MPMVRGYSCKSVSVSLICRSSIRSFLISSAFIKYAPKLTHFEFSRVSNHSEVSREAFLLETLGLA